MRCVGYHKIFFSTFIATNNTPHTNSVVDILSSVILEKSSAINLRNTSPNTPL